MVGELQSLRWKGDYDSGYEEAVKPALLKWLAAYPQPEKETPA